MMSEVIFQIPDNSTASCVSHNIHLYPMAVRLSPVGTGPNRSTAGSLHSFVGMVVVFTGGIVATEVTA